MLRRKNRRFRFLAENVFLQTGRNILIESWNLGSASAHHNYIRVEKIDHLRQSPREPIFESVEGCERGRFTRSTSRNNLRATEGTTS